MTRSIRTPQIFNRDPTRYPEFYRNYRVKQFLLKVISDCPAQVDPNGKLELEAQNKLSIKETLLGEQKKLHATQLAELDAARRELRFAKQAGAKQVIVELAAGNIDVTEAQIAAAKQALDNIKHWLSQVYMIQLAGVCKFHMNPGQTDPYIQAFVSNYFKGDQAKVSLILEKAFGELTRLFEMMSDSSDNSDLEGDGSLDYGSKIDLAQSSVKAAFQPQADQAGKRDAEKGRQHINQFDQFLRSAIRKEHPGMTAKEVLGYIGAGFLLLVALAGVAYLTVLTLGLIHLCVTLPIAIAVTVGTGVAGVGVAVASNPKSNNAISNFFGRFFNQTGKGCGATLAASPVPGRK